ncbi:MAG: phosphate uptake regulator PhoU [Candidatus Methanofastidiosa archaeon]|nr:phosphate uptake regulator PhoU [Candidatus Methanofastidiosa archaeon]
MEIRKLQYSGKGTFVLSLPKRWLEQHDLSKGSPFVIQELEHGLYLTPRFAGSTPKTAVLAVSEHIAREITARYTYGYDRIIVKGPITSPTRTVITETLRELLGYDIIEEAEDRLVITDLLDPSQLNIEKTLRREFFLASLMVQDALKAWETQDAPLARDVIVRDAEVNKLYFLTVRQIRTALQDTTLAEAIGVRQLESIDLRIVTKDIEGIGDHAASIARCSLDCGGCPCAFAAPVRELGTHALSLATEAVHSFLQADKERSSRLLNTKIAFFGEKARLDTEALTCENPLILHDILENIRGIGEKAYEIAQLAYKP